MSPFISGDRANSTTDTSEQDATENCTQPPVDSQSSKKADLAGPGIGDYAELENILPGDYNPLLTPKDTQKAIFHLKRYIEDNLCKELGLIMVEVPLIVDAGVGTASDATLALELGFDGVLMNTAIAAAQDPILMAEAMQHGVLAGRQAFLSGRMSRRLYATASSPLDGVSR